MTPLAVTFRDLVDVALAASVAGIGVTAVFSFALLAIVRGAEARRERRGAAGWTLVAVVASLGVLAACAAGVYVVAS